MKNNLNGDKESHLLDFPNNLLEIIIFGNYSSYHSKNEIKINCKNFINISDNANNLSLLKELFILSSQFLLLKLNYSSFGEAECGSRIIYKRSTFLENILFILEMYIKIFFAKLRDERIFFQ